MSTSCSVPVMKVKPLLGWQPTCGHQYLYRLLRPDEIPLISRFGIKAKEPMMDVSSEDVFKLVKYGYPSPCISTCASWIALTIFASGSNCTTSPKRYAKIDVNALQMSGVGFLDFTIEGNRSDVLKEKAGSSVNGETASEKAKRFDEVLIIGVIPPACITII